MEFANGKYSGNYKTNNLTYGKTYTARIMHNRKAFKKTFETEEEAIVWLTERSTEFGVIKNAYRTIKIDCVEYLEVKLQDDLTFICDIIHKSMVEKYVWHAKVDSHRYTYYVYGTVTGNKKVIFHRIIEPWGTGNVWDQVDHINRKGYDNRLCNLRDGSGNINSLNQKKRKDNVSSKTGVHFSKYNNAWKVQWPENGKRKTKSFGVCDNSGEKNKMNFHKLNRTYDEAKDLAIEFRKEIDKRLELVNGEKV